MWPLRTEKHVPACSAVTVRLLQVPAPPDTLCCGAGRGTAGQAGRLGSPGSLSALSCAAGRGVDLRGVQQVSAPTRDVLVPRDMSGERTFAGFGAAANEEYADAMIGADKLPLDSIKVGCWSGWTSWAWSKCSTALAVDAKQQQALQTWSHPPIGGVTWQTRTAGLHTDSGGQQSVHTAQLNLRVPLQLVASTVLP